MAARKICVSSNNFLDKDEDAWDLVARYEPKSTLEQFLKRMVTPFGVKYIELWYPGWVVKENLKEVTDILSRCDIKGGLIGYYYPISTRKQYAGSVMKGLLDAMDVAEALGFSGVVTLPGPAYWYSYDPNEQEVTADIENLVTNLRKGAELAEDRNLTIYVETGHGPCGNTIERQLKWLRMLNTDRVKLNFHAWAGNKALEFPEAFEKVKDYIGYIHIATFNVPIYMTANNFDGLLRRLDQIGFNGFVGIEHMNNVELLREAIEYCKARGCEL